MRVLIGYPPLAHPDGYLQVGQNRQSKVFSVGTEAAIFPCVMAWAATLVQRDGHDVRWIDCQTEGWDWARLAFTLHTWRPDLICWEVKTPSAKPTYEATRRVREALPGTIIVLVGDHVTALPDEALAQSSANYVLTGGDYDFGLRRLLRHMIGCLAHEVWHTGHQPESVSPTDNDLSVLPPIDRTLCKWKLYSRMGNYLYRPGTHGYSARDCWWRHEGGCTFCSWTNTFHNYRQLRVDQFMADVESAHALGVREYFDDAGTWAPPGPWFDGAVEALTRFNQGRPHYRARCALGCNDRPGARPAESYRRMAAAGFRFILFGLESANFETLRRINKGQQAEDMRNAAKWASEAGLQPHLTVMFGYPWETQADAEQTVLLVRDLFNRGWANSLQATLLMPYPGTVLFRQAQEAGWLLTQDWNRYTMTERILACPMTDAAVKQRIRACYQAAVTPRYLLRKLLTIRTRDDFQFLWRGLRFWVGHMRDFVARDTQYGGIERVMKTLYRKGKHDG